VIFPLHTQEFEFRVAWALGGASHDFNLRDGANGEGISWLEVIEKEGD
jgi:hypothetical protein